MKITFFFRRPSSHLHSIEEQFFAMQKELSGKTEYENYFAPFSSKGLLNRIKIIFNARKHQSDINHITGDINFAAILLSKQKTLLTVHDIGSALNKKGLSRLIIRLFWFTIPFIKVKYITVISEFTKNEILQQFKVNPNKIVVIPDCISDDIKYHPKDFCSEKPLILQIGTKANKNLPNLFEALEGINCKLVIIGHLSEEYKEKLRKHNIEYENKFDVQFPEIVELYQKCDLVSFVSTYEGFGVPVLEAQATGRAVITSNLSPMKDVAGSGALLVDPDKYLEIRKAVQTLISNTEKRNELISEGLKNVEKYSARAVAEKYFELYKKMTK